MHIMFFLTILQVGKLLFLSFDAFWKKKLLVALVLILKSHLEMYLNYKRNLQLYIALKVSLVVCNNGRFVILQFDCLEQGQQP